MPAARVCECWNRTTRERGQIDAEDSAATASFAWGNPVGDGREALVSQGVPTLARCLLTEFGKYASAVNRPCRSSIMLLALGAASSIVDALQSLTSQKSSSAGQSPPSPFDVSANATVAAGAASPQPANGFS